MLHTYVQHRLITLPRRAACYKYLVHDRTPRINNNRSTEEAALYPTQLAPLAQCANYRTIVRWHNARSIVLSYRTNQWQARTNNPSAFPAKNTNFLVNYRASPAPRLFNSQNQSTHDVTLPRTMSQPSLLFLRSLLWILFSRNHPS